MLSIFLISLIFSANLFAQTNSKVDDLLSEVKEYKYNAVGFVSPYYLKDENANSSSEWLTWNDVVELEKSSVFQMQSHSHYHNRIFVEPKLIDFYNPETKINPLGITG